MFDSQEYTLGQDGECFVPILGFDLGDWPEGAADASVVKHDVESAERIGGQGNGSSDVVFDGDITLGESTSVTQAFGCCGPTLGVEVGDHHAGAFRDETFGCRQPHPTRRSGDYCNSSV